MRRKRRKLAREVGPLRLEWHSAHTPLLETVFRWKSEQCRRTGSVDVFRRPWTRDLLHRIFETRTEQFEGVLSALYTGDQIAALHFGMRARHVLHWWFPVYNRSLQRYSPGGILLLGLAESASQRGVEIIDLGRGDDLYKTSFMTAANTVAEGSVRRGSPLAAAVRVHEATRRFAGGLGGRIRRLRARLARTYLKNARIG